MTKWNQLVRAHSRQPRLGTGSAAVAILALSVLYSSATISAPPLDNELQFAEPQGHQALKAQSKHPSRLPSKAEVLTKWRETILHTPLPKKGCFTASFPETKWHEVACTEAPHKRYLPNPDGGSPIFTIGDAADFSATSTTGPIWATTGSFDLVSGVTSTSSENYTLQLNTRPFTTSACASSPAPSTCKAAQQFVYDNFSGDVFIQYWLGHYDPAGGSCPNPAGTDCAQNLVSSTGWCPVLMPTINETYCVVNGPSVNAPKEPLSLLSSLHLSGSAVWNGANDQVSLIDNGQAYTVAGSNYFPDLNTQWREAEFNVFGLGNSSQVNFQPGVTLIGRTTLEGPAASAPTCDKRSFTTETNNLNMVGVALAAPSIVFMESNGTGSPIQSPAESITPAEGASNVPPWPTHLVWPAWPNESVWTIDVDTDSTLTSPNHVTLTGGTLDPLTHSASIDANLLAGKTYYWRVAGNTSTCPRFAHTFSTAAQQPTALSPSSASQNVYPWQAEFTWQAPNGSESFDWSLTDQHHGSDSYVLEEHPPISKCESGQCKVIRDVAVNSNIRWSVRAHGPTNLYPKNDGLDASVEMIKTSTPRATIINSKSDQNPSVNPWDIKIDWEKLKGASGYDLHVRDGLLGPESQVKHYSEVETHGQSATVAHLDKAHAWISVHLFPIGPKISPEKGASFQDQGDADDRVLINAGTQTVPCVFLPFKDCNTSNLSSEGRVTYGSPVTVDWQYVARATGYLVSWYPMTVAPSSGPQPLFVPSVVNFHAQETLPLFETGKLEYSLELPKEVFSPRLGAHVYGQWLSVRAAGPSELSGFPPEDQLSPVARTNGQAPYLDPAYPDQKGDGPIYIDIPEVLIDDPPPQLATDSSGRVILEVINGKAQFTVHWGQDPAIYGPENVEFALFAQHGCFSNGSPLPGGDDIYVQPLIYPRHERTYSFPPNLFYDQDMSLVLTVPSIGEGVSTKAKCLDFHTAPPACGNGVLEGNEQCDEGANNGTKGSSCSSLCTRNQLVCGQPKYNSGGNEGYTGTISLGGPNATGVLYYNTMVIPDNIIVTVGGKELWRSGCTGTDGYLQQPIHGDGTPLGNATIEVQTNCGTINQDETKWAFEVHCENDPNSPTLPPPEPQH